MKNNKKQIFFLIALTQFFLSLPLFANNYLVLDSGYRYDRINEVNLITNPAVATLFFGPQQQFQNLQSYQLGARGLWEVPCSALFIKGAGHYAWNFSGGYNYDYVVKGDLDGHMWDTSLSVGYLFPICNCFCFAPLFGGSYDKQHLEVDNSRASVPFQVTNFAEGATWDSSFYGPWFGFDILFDTDCFPLSFDAGYEFHYGWARVKFDPSATVPLNPTFTYRTFLKDMTGHVFHLQGFYPICSNWLAGLRLQYTFWGNNHKNKSSIPPSSETGLAAGTIQKNESLTWHSFALTLNLGYCF